MPIRRLLRDDTGQFSLVMVVMAPVLLGGAALAIDYGNMSRLRAELQNSADSAALMAALAFADTGSRASAQDIANKAVRGNTLPTTATREMSLAPIALDTTAETVTVTVRATANNLLNGMFGNRTKPISARATASYGNIGKPMEVGVMLDVSGSMAGAKIAGLKSAVTNMLNVLIGPGRTSTDFRIAFAPFSSAVNAGAYASSLVGRASSNNCVGDRIGANAFTNAAPAGDFFNADGRFVISNDENGGVYRDAHFRGYRVAGLDELDVTTICASNASLVPLTGDYATLKTALDGFNVGGITAGHLGVSWAWYLVSERWRSFWPAGRRPNRDIDYQKVVVIMSDGQFNTHYSAANGRPDAQTERLCDAMKAQDVEIFAISYDFSGNSEAVMRRCATKPEYFFDASSTADLQAAFQGIADDLKSRRFPILVQ